MTDNTNNNQSSGNQGGQSGNQGSQSGQQDSSQLGGNSSQNETSQGWGIVDTNSSSTIRKGDNSDISIKSTGE